MNWSHKVAEIRSNMMAEYRVGKGLERDITICGALKDWFLIKMTYSHELKVKAGICRMEIEDFVPMTNKLMDTITLKTHNELASVINYSISVGFIQERGGYVEVFE